MFVVTGANGQTGSVVAKTLLEGGHAVRVIIRQPEQAAAWKKLGAQPVVADLGNPKAVLAAFRNATAAYLMNPPAYRDTNLFQRAQLVHASLIGAARDAELQHVVALSSVGAQHATGTGNILTTHDFEQQLAASGLSFAILRAANFMENWIRSVPVAMQTGKLPSMFHPLDRMLPMVGVRDIGRTAASLLVERHLGIVELRGPRPYSPHDAASILANLTGKTVEATELPRHEWTSVFKSNGFSERTAIAFCEMFDGFNNGRVDFEGNHEIRRGKVTLLQVLGALLERVN